MKTLKKVITISYCLIFICLKTSSQFLPGINTSNYVGVLSTFSNPAYTLGQSTYDVSLFGFSVAAANERSKIKLSDIGKTDFLSDKLIGHEGYNNADLNLNIPALGLLIGAGKKMSFAFTSRGRVFMNANHIDAKLLNAVTNDAEENAYYPYTFVPGNPSLVTATAITDYGFTWANEIWKSGPHYVKGGITVKYVSGVGNVNVGMDVAGVLDADEGDVFVSPGSGSVRLKSGGSAFVDDFKISQLIKFKGGGLGFDLGFAYEFRPEAWDDASTKKEIRANGFIPYKFRFSAALMDIGKVSFTPDPDLSHNYDVHIPASEKFYLSSFDGAKVDELGEVFDNNPEYFTKNGAASAAYKVNLPTTLSVNFDYNVGKGFFVNLDARLPVKSGYGDDFIKTYNTFAVTPRFDGRKMGLFLPITISQLSGVNIGAAFHLGPLYIGSGSILSLLGGGSKQADAFIGFRTGGLKAKKPATKSKKDY